MLSRSFYKQASVKLDAAPESVRVSKNFGLNELFDAPRLSRTLKEQHQLEQIEEIPNVVEEEEPFEVQYQSGQYFEYPQDNIICEAEDTFEGTEFVGKGTYGQVYKNQDVVVKNMALISDDGENFADENLKEACFLTQYSHPLISHIKCLELSPNNKSLRIYQKYGGITLDKFAQNTDISVIESNIVYIIFQMLDLLYALESEDITHSDIKPANILIDSNMKITFIDWGFVQLESSALKTHTSTPAFKAPESMAEIYFGPINDVFSIGLTILYLYNKQYYEPEYIYNKYKTGGKIGTTGLQSITNSQIRSLVELMLEVDYTKRLDASTLINNSLFSQYKNKTFDFSIKDVIVDPNYFTRQTDITAGMRNILFHWQFDICKRFRILKSYTLSCLLVDAYLSKANGDRKTLQLVGCCCVHLSTLFIYEYLPEIQDYVNVSYRAFTREQFIEKTFEILKTLNFTIFKRQFDFEIDEPNYKIIRAIMMDNNSIGKSYMNNLDLYETIYKDKENIDKYVTITGKNLDYKIV